MKRFRIKVCGITRPVDADRVAELGGDMIGLIFHRPSPRFVTIAKAREISRAGSPILDKVGVFVDEEIETILKVAEKVRLSTVQLHGNEPARNIARLQREGFKVIKAIGIKDRNAFAIVDRCRADLVLLDRISADQRGGSGKTFDWSIRPKKKIRNLVLAGGINSDNVAEGVKLFDPLVVDVNSGVESKPGFKSAKKLNTFFAVCDRLRYGRR
jgi:phosphoribosylanthranilate isomerase